MKIPEDPEGIFRLEPLGQGVVAAFHSRLFENKKRNEFLQTLGLSPDKLVMAKQVHGREVVVVERPDPEILNKAADGLVTRVPGLVLGVRIADCVPVFFWDPVRKAAGVAHGGWKGVKAGIIGQMLKIIEKDAGRK